jgi:hypothetical protein
MTALKPHAHPRTLLDSWTRELTSRRNLGTLAQRSRARAQPIPTLDLVPSSCSDFASEIQAIVCILGKTRLLGLSEAFEL